MKDEHSGVDAPFDDGACRNPIEFMGFEIPLHTALCCVENHPNFDPEEQYIDGDTRSGDFVNGTGPFVRVEDLRCDLFGSRIDSVFLNGHHHDDFYFEPTVFAEEDTQSGAVMIKWGNTLWSEDEVKDLVQQGVVYHCGPRGGMNPRQALLRGERVTV